MTIWNTRFWMAVAFLLFLLPVTAQACQLPDVLSGECTVDSTSIEADQDGTRAILSLADIWVGDAKYTDENGSITLPVCVYPNGRSVTVAGTKYPKAAGLSYQKWRGYTNDIADIASEWAEISSISPVTGTEIKSRISFDIRESNGKVRLCDAHPDSAIRIFINNVGANRSFVGSMSDDNLTEGSMTLDLSDKSNSRYLILHEFGHALGFIHEMGHEKWATCSKAVNYARLMDEKGYNFGKHLSDEQQLDELQKNFEVSIADYSTFAMTHEWDGNSIMVYGIPAAVFDNAEGCEFPDPTGRLSDRDRELFLKVYGMKSR